VSNVTAAKPAGNTGKFLAQGFRVGFWKTAGGFGGQAKKRSRSAGQQGSRVWSVAIGPPVNAEEDRRRVSDVCLLVRIEQARMTQVRGVQTATATPKDGRQSRTALQTLSPT
jgi:hypothetical protein